MKSYHFISPCLKEGYQFQLVLTVWHHCNTLDGGRGGASPLSPTRPGLGEDEEEEEEDEFGGQETLITARPGKAEAEFQQDTLVIREEQGVR